MVNETDKNENICSLKGPQSSRNSLRFSGGALPSPQHSIVIIVDPLKALVSGFKSTLKENLEAKASALVKSATALDIPVIVSALGADGDAAELIEGTSFEGDCHQIIWRKTINPWDGGKLLSQLECYSHPALVLAGVAGTHSVAPTILGALQEGYDVHFLADYCVDPPWNIDAETALLRAVQAGAVPTTLNQVLAEWAHEDPKSICRIILAQLHRQPNHQKNFWRLLDGLNK